jgi:hypothetical protein
MEYVYLINLIEIIYIQYKGLEPPMAKKHHHSSHSTTTTTPIVMKEIAIPNSERPQPIKSVEILFGSVIIASSHPAAHFFGTKTNSVA